MRRLAWLLLLLYVASIPWEYSLDLGGRWGYVGRVAGLLLLIVALPALLGEEKLRPLEPLHWAVLALYLWFCLGLFWSIDLSETMLKLRGFFQEMAVVFLVWWLAGTARQLRHLLRSAVAGCWVLALLVLVAFRSAEAVEAEQLRYAAYGQDPNDVARFLVLGMPLAALLARCDSARILRWASLGYLPVALLAVLLTASRSGALAMLVALPVCAVLLLYGRPRRQKAVLFAVPALAAVLWMTVPAGVFARLATIPEQFESGNLNDRVSIWTVGWRAFLRAPLLGYGAGNFTLASGLSPDDTAHNTALALAVAGGLAALFLASAIGVLLLRAAWRVTRQASLLGWTFLTALAVLLLSATTASLEESRFTWLVAALIALAERLARENPVALAASFPGSAPTPEPADAP